MTKPVKSRMNGGPGAPQSSRGGSETVVDDLLGRLAGLMQGARDFVGLVTLFEALSMVEVSSTSGLAAVAARIRELTDGVRESIANWSSLIDRLERVAEVLHPPC